MKLNDLKPAKGAAQKERKRLGRGAASNWGKTSGRGMNGQKTASVTLTSDVTDETLAQAVTDAGYKIKGIK